MKDQPLFPAFLSSPRLRQAGLSAPMALPGASRKKRIPSSFPALLAIATGAVMTAQTLIAESGQVLDDSAFHWEDYAFVYDAPLEGETPTKVWERSAPIGNGHFGARISGSPGEERIHFNHVTFWGGKPHNNPNP